MRLAAVGTADKTRVTTADVNTSTSLFVDSADRRTDGRSKRSTDFRRRRSAAQATALKLNPLLLHPGFYTALADKPQNTRVGRATPMFDRLRDASRPTS